VRSDFEGGLVMQTMSAFRILGLLILSAVLIPVVIYAQTPVIAVMRLKSGKEMASNPILMSSP
jgi:hypothetical protein